jgi:hypothetical protein
LNRLLAYVRDLGPRNTAAVVAFAAVTVGCAMERLSLGLIVPGVFVLTCLVWSHVHGVE